MFPQRARSPARLLAPAALVVSALAVVVIVLTAGGGDDATTPQDAGSVERGTTTTPSDPKGETRARRSSYTVKRNDNLGTIAQKTGVEVERLQELNPQLDPQTINPGQKIKLRE